ncbi:MAG: DUF4426 domain-containing protein [Pseudomonadales bacterium]|nr:DUF4426 domain-containing protein [Pseudomonadales bacterium]NRA15688.1 DUF4426 domain-containing protein [Oceanospirillaceae bacterium]
MKTLFNAIFLLLFSTAVMAQQIVETPGYIVHYSAFNSTLIDADAAKKNKLVRSKYTAMLNISVFAKNADGSTHAVKSFNSGTVENLLGQQQQLEFVTIAEGKAVYYIASFRFADEEVMNFKVSVQPDPNQQPIAVNISQKFYVE